MAKNPIPFDFVIEELSELNITVKPMFGCHAIYIEDKIVLILRDKKDKTKRDDGVWLATVAENHESLQKEFPYMRSIELFGTPPTAWQVLPVSSSDFEDAVLHACDLIRNGDPRIGRIPQKKLRKSAPRKQVAKKKAISKKKTPTKKKARRTSRSK